VYPVQDRIHFHCEHRGDLLGCQRELAWFSHQMTLLIRSVRGLSPYAQ
jgi:hypothetical protein